MSKFQAFMKGHVKEVENVKMKLDRFEEEIELRVLDSGKADEITDRCFKNKPGKGGRQERVFDAVKYNREVCVDSIVYPDLHDADLQSSYGVKDAYTLYSKMFTMGEANQILQKVTEISGLDETLEDVKEEAKN